ncbi:MAG: cytochrome c biogenesis protein ResB [Verrucomicrobiae bacterium]
MARRFLDFISSLKLTIVCLSAAMVLVFVGTLAQVSFGIHEVQERYFQSLIVWWPAGSQGLALPVFPGGHLIGGVLLVNLVAAHLRRFRWSWSKLGIHLTHAGLIIMLAGGLFTDLFSVESFMRLAPGETKNYSEDFRAIELALIDGSDKDFDHVTAIPEGRLKRGGTIAPGSLPFQITVRSFYQNAQLQPLEQAGANAAPAATRGAGAHIALSSMPHATAENSRDSAGAVIEISSGGAPSPASDTWLVSAQLEPQTFSFAGKPYRLVMRQARYYKPFSLTLQKFTHERYAGTQIAKNFASRAVLNDPERNERRDVLISMNHPLRYRGETFFQSGFEENEAATILQVVYNPSFIAPYLACVIVSAGLLFQLTYHFAGFLRRRKSRSAK